MYYLHVHATSIGIKKQCYFICKTTTKKLINKAMKKSNFVLQDFIHLKGEIGCRLCF